MRMYGPPSTAKLLMERLGKQVFNSVNNALSVKDPY